MSFGDLLRNPCHEFETGSTTSSGEKLKGWICYCGTTGCRYQGKKDYPLPKEVKIAEEPITPEDEKRFYDKIFGRNKLTD